MLNLLTLNADMGCGICKYMFLEVDPPGIGATFIVEGIGKF
jgi:hypothetical protein